MTPFFANNALIGSHIEWQNGGICLEVGTCRDDQQKVFRLYEGLEKNVQGRYRFKLGLVGQNLHDPYTFEPDPDSTDALPEITKSNKYT